MAPATIGWRHLLWLWHGCKIWGFTFSTEINQAYWFPFFMKNCISMFNWISICRFQVITRCNLLLWEKPQLIGAYNMLKMLIHNTDSWPQTTIYLPQFKQTKIGRSSYKERRSSFYSQNHWTLSLSNQTRVWVQTEN